MEFIEVTKKTYSRKAFIMKNSIERVEPVGTSSKEPLKDQAKIFFKNGNTPITTKDTVEEVNEKINEYFGMKISEDLILSIHNLSKCLEDLSSNTDNGELKNFYDELYEFLGLLEQYLEQDYEF